MPEAASHLLWLLDQLFNPGGQDLYFPIYGSIIDAGFDRQEHHFTHTFQRRGIRIERSPIVYEHLLKVFNDLNKSVGTMSRRPPLMGFMKTKQASPAKLILPTSSRRANVLSKAAATRRDIASVCKWLVRATVSRQYACSAWILNKGYYGRAGNKFSPPW